MNLYDLAYALGVAAASPIWATRSKSRAKVLSAFRERFGDVPPRQGGRLAIWIHAVSLGEVNAARALIEQLLASRNDLDVIVSTTTTTGHERARNLYTTSSRVWVVRYPLDFTSAITRALDALRPSVVVLMELETWPNFLRQCQTRNIPVILANGRITTHSFSRYRLIKPIMSTMLRRLAAICVQDDEYAERFKTLGAPADKITVTGTMKYDSAEVADSVTGAEELQRDLQLSQDKPLWVCGSTGPGEEAVALRVYRRLLAHFPMLRLAIIPRHPQRFDDVANLIRSKPFDLLRRSNAALPLPVPEHSALGIPVILGDTMGELRKFYSLATVVFVGRSLVDLGSRQHGSDMIEPAALAKPCIVGPFTGNFDQTVRALKSADGIVEVADEIDLEAALRKLLSDLAAADAMGRRAQAVVRQQQGATALHLKIITTILAGAERSRTR